MASPVTEEDLTRALEKLAETAVTGIERLQARVAELESGIGCHTCELAARLRQLGESAHCRVHEFVAGDPPSAR